MSSYSYYKNCPKLAKCKIVCIVTVSCTEMATFRLTACTLILHFFLAIFLTAWTLIWVGEVMLTLMRRMNVLWAYYVTYQSDLF